MNAKTLKRIERSKWTLLRALERAVKAEPFDEELRALNLEAGNEWSQWHKRLRKVNAAAAAKKDKGEVLFTIFYPDGAAVRSITRTPHRLIHHWETQPWYASKPIEDHVDVRRPDAWERDLTYQWSEVRKTCDRARERRACARL